MRSYPGGSVLVLEDDEQSRDTVRCILRGGGFRVICAADSFEAIHHIESDAKIDIALVDVKMPPGTPSGVSFVRMAQSRRRPLKVIFMSASVNSQDFTRFDEGEVFLYKPFAPHHLLHAVARVAA